MKDDSSNPKIDGCAIALGDIVSGPQVGPFSSGRVKGWSSCGRWLYVGWLGVVYVGDARWCHDIAAAKFARIYRPVAENRWHEVAEFGLGMPAIAA